MRERLTDRQTLTGTDSGKKRKFNRDRYTEKAGERESRGENEREREGGGGARQSKI